MPPIPETGGGLSGFIAYLLWHVYRYFPFQGTWDWLLLFISLALITRLFAVPTSWKQNQWIVSEYGDEDAPFIAACLPSSLIQTGSMWLLIWFFGTSAGHTFLDGRTTWFAATSPLEVSGLLFWVSAGFLFTAGLAWFGIGVGTMVEVYGEEAFGLDEKEKGFLEAIWISSLLFLLMVLGAHLFYWYWSVASLVMMQVYALVDMVTAISLGFTVCTSSESAKTKSQS